METLTQGGPEPRRPDTRPARPAGRQHSGRIPPSAAILARPLLVALPILVLLVPSLFLTLSRTPTYTAESRLLVGGFDIDAQAIPGFVAATQTLASTYARLTSTPAILDRVAAKLGQSPTQVKSHVSASAVPESSIIAVKGSGINPAAAAEYADAAAQALETYTSGLSTRTPAEEILSEFLTANQALVTNQAERDRLARAFAVGTPDAAQQAQLAAAEARVQTAQLQADTLRAKYTKTQAGAVTTGVVSIVSPAAASGDDKRSTVQLAIAIAVGMGLIVGIALATLVVNRAAVLARRRDAGA